MVGGSETRLSDVRFQAFDRQTTMTAVGAHCRPSAFPFAIGRFWFNATFNAANLTDRVWSATVGSFGNKAANVPMLSGSKATVISACQANNEHWISSPSIGLLEHNPTG